MSEGGRIHVLQIRLAAFFLALALAGHAYRPEDQLFVALIPALSGFLFGKFSNGYPKPKPTGGERG